MNRLTWLAGAATLAAFLFSAGEAAARVPMTRAPGMRDPGTRGDITVPYETTGKHAFGAYFVAPIVYASPNVDNPSTQGTQAVFNLIYYGSRQGFGDRSEGARPRPANTLRPPDSPVIK